MKNASLSIQLPKLGKANYNLVYLILKYIPIVKRQRPSIFTVNNALDQLRAERDCTDWKTSVEDSSGLDVLTQTVSVYIFFCVKSTIHTKQVSLYLNNNLLIIKRVNDVINKK